jgi:biotin synthase
LSEKNGKGIERQEAQELFKLQGPSIIELASVANKVRIHLKGKEIDLCSLINAKSGRCPENCSFCSQSSHFNTYVLPHPLVDKRKALKRAKQVEYYGAKHFCIVTSGKSISDNEFVKVLDIIKTLKKETSLKIDCSLGFITEDRAYALKEAGISRYNHNLETSESYYKNICTTHTFQDRLNTIKILKKLGIKVCSGGIIGLGETLEDRIDLAYILKEIDVDCIPINILNPRPGTPLENAPPLSPLEIIKTLSIFRLIHPKKIIKLAAGREINLRDLQSLAMVSGVDGIVIGGYLTTQGREVQDDLQMLKDLELLE